MDVVNINGTGIDDWQLQYAEIDFEDCRWEGVKVPPLPVQRLPLGRSESPTFAGSKTMSFITYILNMWNVNQQTWEDT
jgi:hypothetical protein